MAELKAKSLQQKNSRDSCQNIPNKRLLDSQLMGLRTEIESGEYFVFF